jgi:hypothetical protein
MTGYTVHTGSNEKFSEGWDQIFKKSGKSRATSSPKKAVAKKKPAAKRKVGKKR